ncbi:MAG: response regulator transcription factor [Rhodanobacteraceae bacterium]|nr:response regulator transcription factor [Rhodanobacteraceae bacterium]
MTPTALVADDEPLLRSGLVRQLQSAWPELRVVAEARNGGEAVELFERHQPAICFLDVHMPGLSGVEAAQLIGSRAHLVFVTAFQQYAVQAFEQGALDYLVKPVEGVRLAETVRRLRERMLHSDPTRPANELLQALVDKLQRGTAQQGLRWIRASAGNVLRLIPADAIDYLRAGDKYTTIAWRDSDHQALEAVVRTPLKELLSQLDENLFAQVHRSFAVNLNAVDHVLRDENYAEIRLRGRAETLPVSRAHLHLFRQM